MKNKVKEIKLKGEVLKEAKKIMKKILAARIGLAEMSYNLEHHDRALWKFLNQYFPETKIWSCRFNNEKFIIKFQYKLEEET